MKAPKFSPLLICLCIIGAIVLTACDNQSSTSPPPTVGPQPTNPPGTCSQDIHIVDTSSPEILIYFNDCALQALKAQVNSATATVIISAFILSVCGPCSPFVQAAASGVTALLGFIGANIGQMIYESQLCQNRGAYLSLNLNSLWKEEKVC